MAAGVAEPRHADPGARRERDAGARRLDPADDFVTRDDRQLGIGQVAVDDVQVRAADAAGLDAQPNLAGAGNGLGPVLEREPFTGSPQRHRAHEGQISPDRERTKPFRRLAARRGCVRPRFSGPCQG